MHLDDREARVAFSWLDYAVVRRNLAREPIPPALAQLMHRLEAELRDATPRATSELIGAREAARILHCGERLVRTRAQELGGRRISGRWVFDREKVEEFARTPRRRQCPNLPRTD
ncbi:hypothetical protein [Nocardia araoensis]|uniref:hypothetical protein n=1 Tax=Nocardia araoensis TaxID=228600 RepID=UPI0002E9E3D6|nr:hypothetical protein [Nocardia araoensis]